MRIAVVSDVHGNMTALEAVIADLRARAPDLVVHGGDLCSGSCSAEVIDRIHALGWPGVYGNTDEALWDPGKADAYLAGAGLDRMREIVAEQTAFTLAELGSDRLAWLRGHPLRWTAQLLANSGCLSLSYDGDPRAAYAVVDPDRIEIRRVEYDIEREARALVSSGFPYASWMAEMLRAARYIPPPASTI